MIRRTAPAGIKSYETAKRFAARNRKADARVWIKDSLKKIGNSYKKLVVLKRKPGLSKEQIEAVEVKISKLNDLQKLNLSLLKKVK